MNADELADIVQAWAAVHMPEAWKSTQSQRQRPDSFRRFLSRLIRRWYESGARDIPLRVLQESDLRVTLKDRKSGKEFTVCGRYAEGDITFDFRFLSIMQSNEHGEIGDILDVIGEFDAVIEYGKPRPLAASVPPREVKPEPVVKEAPKASAVLELLPREFRSRDD
jgi:hypothetical protein